MKLTPLGIFIILLGALALCPLLQAAGLEGFSGSRQARSHGRQPPKGRKHRAHGRPAEGRLPSSDARAAGGGAGKTYSGGAYAGDSGGGWRGGGAAGPDIGSGGYVKQSLTITEPAAAGAAGPPQVTIEAPPSGQAAEVPGSGGTGSQIPPGQEDQYILKSEIVPPVCPACPTNASCPRQKPCAPCPPCARCPEPAFECQKVPNYKSNNADYLPRPILTDFSQFGM